MKTSAQTAFVAVLVSLLSTLASTLSADEGKRIAFVVGVDRYEKLPDEAQLKVAVSDAKRMQTTLESLDPPFTVRLVTDLGARDVESAFDAFLDDAKGAECALIYFAGHGVEYHGSNFLIVSDTSISDISVDVERMKRRLTAEAVSLQGWVDSLDGTRAQVKVVILDCCRDNPLKAHGDNGTRSVVGGSRGLAQVTPPSGTLISYSADAGQRANDGLFTEVLAKNLKVPGLNILKVFAKTREEVREISTSWSEEDASRGLAPDSRRSRHEPAEYNKLNFAGTDFAFTRGTAPSNPGSSPNNSSEMAELRAQLAAAEKAREEAEKKAAMPTPAPLTRPDPAPAAGVFPATRGMDGTQAGETRTFGGIEMVWCPPGDFLMGSPVGEAHADNDETQHRVSLTKGYWLAKTECTQTQWQSVVGSNPSEFEGADLPVERVRWDDLQSWFTKMNKQSPLPTGWKWDLPTEAQWEYACRAGTVTAYSFGNDVSQLGKFGNFADKNLTGSNQNDMSQDDGVGNMTARVKSYEANAWGLHDMHGNVSEWCRDRYGPYPSGAVTDPVGPKSGSLRVPRGGDWNLHRAFNRSASRSGYTTDTRLNNLGFRPAAVSTSR